MLKNSWFIKNYVMVNNELNRINLLSLGVLICLFKLRLCVVKNGIICLVIILISSVMISMLVLIIFSVSDILLSIIKFKKIILSV